MRPPDHELTQVTPRAGDGTQRFPPVPPPRAPSGAPLARRGAVVLWWMCVYLTLALWLAVDWKVARLIFGH